MGSTFAIKCESCETILDIENKDVIENADQTFTFDAECHECGKSRHYENLSEKAFEKLMRIGISETDRMIKFLGVSRESYFRHNAPDDLSVTIKLHSAADTPAKKLLLSGKLRQLQRAEGNWWTVAKAPAIETILLYDPVNSVYGLAVGKENPIRFVAMLDLIAHVDRMLEKRPGHGA